MNTYTRAGIISLLLIAGIGIAIATTGAAPQSASRDTGMSTYTATIHKEATCGCCGVYTSYMRRNDVSVDVENVADLAATKRMFDIPYELGSCHTTEIGGYIVEGHVPFAAIEQLLEEQPDIAGIGMGGMPQGSPGMSGPQIDDFVIHEITNDHTVGAVFMTL